MLTLQYILILQSWQLGGNQYGAPPMSRGGMPPYSYSPPPPPNPYASPFSMASGDGGSFMSLNSTNSSSTNNSSGQSSLLRYPSLGNGVGGGLGSLDFLGPNGSPGLSSFALSYGGGAPPAPVSPYMRYASSGYAAPGPYMLGGDYDRPRGYEEKNRPVRSPLLEEFRADKLKRWGVRVSRSPCNNNYISILMPDALAGHARSYRRVHVRPSRLSLYSRKHSRASNKRRLRLAFQRGPSLDHPTFHRRLCQFLHSETT